MSQKFSRPPVITVLGHVDHGKSSFLDYVCNTKKIKDEAGGITQHVHAYKAAYTTKEGEEINVTFIDTPGHESFKKMRRHGATLADLALLIVSAEDGVKQQTIEALEEIKATNTPYVVAISKIDSPQADIDKTIYSLLQHEVLLEGFGGDISYVPISSITGKGIQELLDLLILTARIEEFTGDTTLPASGFVLESHIDSQKGISGIFLIKDGMLKKDMYIVTGGSMARVKTIEGTNGEKYNTASLSDPVLISGFNSVPAPGNEFYAYINREDALRELQEERFEGITIQKIPDEIKDTVVIPVVIKTGNHSAISAVEHELEKIIIPHASLSIVGSGTGPITNTDIGRVSGFNNPIIVGFHTSIDPIAKQHAHQRNISVETFDVIYNLLDWVTKLSRSIVKKEYGLVVGNATVIKVFSNKNNTYLLGSCIVSGAFSISRHIHILRDHIKIGEGTIHSIQHNKQILEKIEGNGKEMGTQIITDATIEEGDILEALDK